MPAITTAFAQGLAASRPAASSTNAGFFWLSTDTNGGTLYQSTGSAWVQVAAGVSPPASAIGSGQLAPARGGTGLDGSAAANGQLLIGNGSGFSLAALSAGTNVTITNSAGGISIAASAGGGAASFSWATKTANYTISSSDTGILADATSGAITMTLPTAVGSSAQYGIKKKDSSQNKVSIATSSSQTIDGHASWQLGAQNQSITLASDGSNWYRLDTASGPEKIDEQVLASSAATISFSGIPAYYRNLLVQASGRGTSGSSIEQINLTINSDGGANYDSQKVQGNGGTAFAQENLAQTALILGHMTSGGATSGLSSSFESVLFNYADTTFQKSARTTTDTKSGTATGNLWAMSWGGWWRSTAAITSLSFALGSGSFAAGTVISLYGCP